jgi:cytoskeletal protein CcmA (bactofilin family)
MMSNKSGEQGKQTTVEEGTEFKGTLTSTCPVVVRGMLDGDIKAPSLNVAESGTVVGNVRAESIRSEGVLAGNVDADDVYLSGSVRSETVIRAKTLEVKLQRERGKLEVTFGECVLEVGDEPGAQKSVDKPAEMSADKRVSAAPAAAMNGEAEAKHDMLAKREEGGKKKKAEASDEQNGKSERLSVPPPA